MPEKLRREPVPLNAYHQQRKKDEKKEVEEMLNRPLSHKQVKDQITRLKASKKLSSE